jgi:hypothetical protein
MLCMTWSIRQQIWEYKVEEKLYLGISEQKRLNTTDIDDKLLQNTGWSAWRK